MDISEMRRDPCQYRPANVYEAIRCGTCGHPWDSHPEDCSQHPYRGLHLKMQVAINVAEHKHVLINI